MSLSLKRAMLLNDLTAPCPKGWQDPARPGVPLTCALLNEHKGRCVEDRWAASDRRRPPARPW